MTSPFNDGDQPPAIAPGTGFWFDEALVALLDKSAEEPGLLLPLLVCIRHARLPPDVWTERLLTACLEIAEVEQGFGRREALSLVLDKLDRLDPATARRLTEVIGATPEALRDVLDHPRFGDLPEAPDLCVRLLTRGGRGRIVAAALDFLREGQPERLSGLGERIRGGFRSRDPLLRRASTEAYPFVEDACIDEALLALLRDGNEDVCGVAFSALARIGGADALSIIVSALDDPEPSVRGSACLAAGLVCDASHLDLLEAKLDDPDERVRETAVIALAEIDRDHVLTHFEALVEKTSFDLMFDLLGDRKAAELRPFGLERYAINEAGDNDPS